MKGYRLWYTKLDSQKFIVNRDFIFNEKAIFHLRKESVAIDKNYYVDK